MARVMKPKKQRGGPRQVAFEVTVHDDVEKHQSIVTAVSIGEATVKALESRWFKSLSGVASITVSFTHTLIGDAS